ncbi:hypothetical protein HY408_00045 [Candidatus Gottesmanbacteria bacterium]|nr:hypothetical protein [Candidatus Gottesmanbacteria bacterium]
MKQLFDLLLKSFHKRNSRDEEERVKHSLEFRDQLMKLKQKGLSIPIFTL